MAELGDTIARAVLPVLSARARTLARHPTRRDARWPIAPPHRKIFVVGCPRSGTTWIRRLIGEHPRVLTGPESHAYPQVLGPFVDLGLGGVEGWRRVLDRWWRGRRRRLESGLFTWTSFRDLCGLVTTAMAYPDTPDDRSAERVIEAIFDAYFVAHGGTAEHVLLEKTPQHVFWIDRILERWPDARVIEVLRDGRDVCVSLEMRSATQRWAPRERRRQIDTWVRAVSSGLAFRENPAFTDRIHLLRFEAVKTAPLDEATRLLQFLDLPSSRDETAKMLEAVSIERHANKGAGRHVRSGAVGDWRAHFTRDDEALFAAVAGDVARRVGYEV